MIAPAFAQDSAVGHGDADGPRHRVVGVLDQSIAARIVKLAVAVAGYAVELQQPVGKPVAGGNLPGLASDEASLGGTAASGEEAAPEDRGELR